MDFFVWQGVRRRLSWLSNDEQRRQTEKDAIYTEHFSLTDYWSYCFMNGDPVGWEGAAGVSRSTAPCLRNGMRLPAHTPPIPALQPLMLGFDPSLRIRHT